MGRTLKSRKLVDQAGLVAGISGHSPHHMAALQETVSHQSSDERRPYPMDPHRAAEGRILDGWTGGHAL